MHEVFPIPVIPVLRERDAFSTGAHAAPIEQLAPFFRVFPRPELKVYVHLVLP